MDGRLKLSPNLWVQVDQVLAPQVASYIKRQYAGRQTAPLARELGLDIAEDILLAALQMDDSTGLVDLVVAYAHDTCPVPNAQLPKAISLPFPLADFFQPEEGQAYRVQTNPKPKTKPFTQKGNSRKRNAHFW